MPKQASTRSRQVSDVNSGPQAQVRPCWFHRPRRVKTLNRGSHYDPHIDSAVPFFAAERPIANGAQASRWFRMRVSVVPIVMVALMISACATAMVPVEELRAYDGTYEISGAGPPDRVPLTGMLTINAGSYLLDTTLGVCKARPLKVPKPVLNTLDHTIAQLPTEFSCGDLLMRIMMSDGRVGAASGYYSSEGRVALVPVCVAWPTDSAGRERGDCTRWRTDYETILTERSYSIRIVRKSS